MHWRTGPREGVVAVVESPLLLQMCLKFFQPLGEVVVGPGDMKLGDDVCVVAGPLMNNRGEVNEMSRNSVNLVIAS